MNDFTFAQTVWLHIIVAIPSTVAAVAALVKSMHVKRDTQRIVIAVNGERDALLAELAELRARVARREAP